MRRTTRALVGIAIYLMLSSINNVTHAQARTMFPSVNLFSDQATTASSEAKKPTTGNTTYLVRGLTTAGAGAATIIIEVTNVETPTSDTQWVTAGTIQLTLATTETAAGMTICAPWRNIRARLSAISGTGAKVSVDVGAGV